MENVDRRHLTNGSSGLAGQARSQLNRMLYRRFAQGEKNHLKLYFAGPLFSIAEKTGLPGLKQIASLKTSEHLNILIVAHGHLNRALAAAFTGMEASFSLTLTMENTGLSVLKGPEMKQNYRIHLWNQTVHLENF